MGRPKKEKPLMNAERKKRRQRKKNLGSHKKELQKEEKTIKKRG